MKNTLRILLHFLAFLFFYAAFFAGSLLSPFHLKWFVTHPSQITTCWFVPDGLILITILYLLILAIEAATKRIRTAAPWTTLAFALAVLLGLLSKFGFVQHDLF